MTTQDLTITLLVDQTPEEVFNVITNVRGWWSETIEGNTEKLGDEFIYRYKDLHCSRQRLIEAVPGQKAVWLVTDGALSFIGNKSEWTGTQLRFDIKKKGDQTELRFTHVGLTPDCECFDACSKGWGMYIGQSLYNLITTGKGQPDKKENKQPVESEIV